MSYVAQIHVLKPGVKCAACIGKMRCEGHKDEESTKVVWAEYAGGYLCYCCNNNGHWTAADIDYVGPS